MASILFFLFSLMGLAAAAQNQSLVPALFILGDSTVDSGNNNVLWTLAQATFLPYGRDFDTKGPTGRFTNGRLSVDYLADLLGLPLTPPYMIAIKKNNYHKGVNFASAGSGVLNSSGSVFGQRITTYKQLEYLANVKSKLAADFGQKNASKIMAESLYYVSTGSNDIVNNYLLPGSSLLMSYPRDEFLDMVVSQFGEQLKLLYNLGARRIVVASLSPLGSVPSQLSRFATRTMSGALFLNSMAESYNTRLFKKLTELRRSLPGVTLIYNNLYDVLQDVTKNYKHYGYQHADTACCGLGSYKGAVPCLPYVPVCQHASEYVFWDEFHPTSRTYSIITKKLWTGNKTESYPINVKQMLTEKRL